MMNTKWLEFLAEKGAVVENSQAVSVEETTSPYYSLDDTYICELTKLGLIRASGEEAQSFLHGQFTNDLNNVSSELSQLSSYCNHKGRMLSIFRIFKRDNNFYLTLPREILDTTLKKLTMFKMMAKVDLFDESDELVQFGIAGPNTESILSSLHITIPHQVNHCTHSNEITIIRLPSENTRVLFISNTNLAIAFWKQISAKISIATSGFWDLHDIHSGIPQVCANTSEAFIPQMTNLELIDGVNFNKGCYPGQEVVARTHYLGKPNRRMYQASIADDNAPESGTNIYTPEDASQPVGKIVIAQKTSDENCTALIVLRTEKKDDEALHLGSVAGPKVLVQPLPYSLDSKTDANLSQK